MKITVIENRRFSILGLFVALLAIVYSFPVFSQKPEIRSLDRTIGGTSDLITIKGEGFGTNAANLRVYFGAVKATIESVSAQILEVRVPPGTTYDNVSVTNTASGLTAYSKEQFHLAFGGEHEFNPDNLEGQFNFDSQPGLYDLCMCDFDGDNKTDVITANRLSNFVSIFANSSAGPGNINLVSTLQLNANIYTIHVKCGDLNGDGKPDLVLTQESGERVIIFKNNSTGPGNFSFASQTITLSLTSKPKEIEIADLDIDGRPEIILSNNAVNTSLFVLRNQSNSSTLSFASPINITIPGALITSPLIAKDLNGDFLPEIITTLFNKGDGNKIFIIHNRSMPGNFDFETRLSLDLAGIATADIKVGDLNGDGKPEIITSAVLNNSILIYRNSSSNTAISFAAPQDFAMQPLTSGIALGDLDGDKKLDIVTASYAATGTPSGHVQHLAILNNITSISATSFSFKKHSKVTDHVTREINIGDLDGDGKPDIVFTSENANKVSVFRNKTCLSPTISPEGPLTVCSGSPLRLQTNTSRGTTYEWRRNGVLVSSTTNSFLDATLSGQYTVTAIQGTCSKLSNEVSVTITPGVLIGIPAATNNGPVCVGSPLQLSVNDVGATEYKWRGPGYTATGRTPSIPNIQFENAGRYYVDIYQGSCLAQTVSTVVQVIEAPTFIINTNGSNVICQGDTKTISIAPTPSGFTYKWYQSNNEIIGAVNSTLAVSTSGSYSAKATYAGCVELQTPTVSITAASQNPTSNFADLSPTCTGSAVQFNNQSTSDPNITTTYFWDFGDGNYSTQRDPAHTYTAASTPTYTIKLKVSYNDACAHETTKFITVSLAPAISITSLSNKVCPGDSLLLGVSGPTYTSYLWSTTATSPTILAKEPGMYTVDVKTSTNCILRATKQIDAHPRPLVTATAEPARIPEGGSSQLSASGLINYQWTPIDGLSNTMIHNPLAQPTTTTQYKVSGKDSNGCYGEAIIEVGVIGDPIVNKLGPKSFFTPNESDIINPYWSVTKIEDYPQCGVSVFDDKGVKVFEAKPYLNNWDGTFNGRRLPDGVYYYFIRCDGEENKPKAGTITLLR